MRATLLACVLLLAACAAGAAPEPPSGPVVCYGDSLTAGDPWGYPAPLQALRPDLTIVNAGQGGDVTANLARFRSVLARYRPRMVVLMLGTNDPIGNFLGMKPVTKPRRSVANLWRMVTRARHTGAAVVIVTQPPAFCVPGTFCTDEGRAIRTAHTEAMAALLRRRRLPGGVTLADARADLSFETWHTLSDDGLHENEAGAEWFATFIAAHLPE